MPSQKKIDAVTALQAKVAQAKSVVFAKYTGMSVPAQQKLYREVQQAGGEIVIARNRLLKIALNKAEGLDSMLEDQLLTVFSNADEVAAVKALDEYIKANSLPEVRGGFLENRVISADEVKSLAKMPGKKEMLGQLVRTIQGPVYGLRNVLEAGPRNLVYALQAIARKNESAQ